MEPPLPESYGGLTYDDVDQLTKALPLAIRYEVEWAARILNGALAMANNTRSWRELVDEDCAVEIILGDLGALDKDGEPDPNSDVLKEDRHLPQTLGRAFQAFDGALRLVRAPPEHLISDSVLHLVVKRTQTETSRKAVQRRQLDAADRSTELGLFVQDVLREIKSDANNESIRWLVNQVQDAWCARQPKDASPPSRGRLTPILRALLPEHPKLNPQK